MTHERNETIRKALDACKPPVWTQAAAEYVIRNAPQWLAVLLAECEALKRERDRYERALQLVAPDGRGLQLFLGEGPAPGMPMFGRVSLVSPYLIATKPEGPDESFAGACEVYQYTYDEDTQHEAECCTVGYFVTEDWLCERDEGAEEKYDEALARAEAAERERDRWKADFVDASRPELGTRADIIDALDEAKRLRDEAIRTFRAREDAIEKAEKRALTAEMERDSLLAENARLREERDALIPSRAHLSAIDSVSALAGMRGMRLDESTLADAIRWREAVDRAHASQPKGDDTSRIYPCDRCGKMRTKAEGGTTFTVCDACWDLKPKGDGGSDV